MQRGRSAKRHYQCRAGIRQLKSLHRECDICAATCDNAHLARSPIQSVPRDSPRESRWRGVFTEGRVTLFLSSPLLASSRAQGPTSLIIQTIIRHGRLDSQRSDTEAGAQRGAFLTTYRSIRSGDTLGSLITMGNQVCRYTMLTRPQSRCVLASLGASGAAKMPFYEATDHARHRSSTIHEPRAHEPSETLHG